MKTSSVFERTFKPFLALSFALTLISIHANAQLKIKNLMIDNKGVAGAVGTVYRAKSAYIGIDALIRIDSLVNNARILEIDMSSTGYDDAFQPRIQSSARRTSYAVFTISFVLANTNIPAIMASLTATNLDLDGNSVLKEFSEFNMSGGLAIFMNSNPQISVSANHGKFYAINVSGIEYDGIDTAADAVMFKVKKNLVSQFQVRLGAVINGNSDASRQYSVYMKDFDITNASTLPVKLLNFSAILKADKANLSWATTEHRDFSHFVLQRSIDGKNFHDIMTLMTESEVSSSVNQYGYNDPIHGINSTVVYYRLQMVDVDGSYGYSPIRLVRLNANNNVQIQTFPNPVVNELRVMIPANWQEKTTTYEIYSSNGLLVSRTKVANATQVQQLNVQSLGSGNYIIRVTNGQEMSSSKFVKY